MKFSFNSVIGVFLSVVFLMVGATPGTASAAESDGIAMLDQLYTFVDPHCASAGGTGCEQEPEELIVALTIKPFATGAEQFSEDVIYHFHFENGAQESTKISCSFSASQIMTCSGMGGLTAQTRVGETGVGGQLRVYAGLRDNPVPFDLEALNNFATQGIAAYTDPGTDSYAGSNVLAIVIGIKISAFSRGTDPNHNVQKIWAASERVDGDGINGAITGSWYNPVQNGQGWVVEIIGKAAGEMELLSFFYGYDDNGEQLWMVTGVSVIDGTTASADLYRTNASGFGGDYDPSSFVLGDVVGTVIFDFENCESGTVTFVSADQMVLADFQNDIRRLSSIESLDCALLTAGQVDRVGRPFVEVMIPAGTQEAYYTNSDPTTWDAAYNATFLGFLQLFAMADGDPAWNGFYTAQEWADVFADDRQQIDIRKSQSVAYMTIERSEIEGLDYEDGSGRALDYDIHENLFNVLITSFDPFVDDYLDGNDVPFQMGFPFLANPHMDN